MVVDAEREMLNGPDLILTLRRERIENYGGGCQPPPTEQIIVFSIVMVVAEGRRFLLK